MEREGGGVGVEAEYNRGEPKKLAPSLGPLLRKGVRRRGERTCRERPDAAADLAEPVYSRGPDLLNGGRPTGGGKAALLVWPPRVGDFSRKEKGHESAFSSRSTSS